MKRKNAFTLVELLAVIVILAIVLIIAVPGVLSIINKTKENALDRQLDMIKEASRLYVTSDSDVTWVGQDTKMTTVTLDALKTKGYLDQKIIDPKTKKEITCAKTVITKTGSKYDYDVSLCDQVNSSPRLSSNMIPIRYDGTTWVKADYTNQDNNWYDYDNQQWANIATVSEATRDAYKKANIGSEVKMEDINAMFVWIPRFKYKLFNVDRTVSPVGNPNMAGDYMIDVQFETASTPKSTGTKNGQWLTHPAFTFGGEELEGLWIGKFENGYYGATSTTEAEQNVVDPTKLIIKPSVYSWRSIAVKNIMENALGLQDNPTFGLEKVADPHLMKNMEWGAMVYLTHSTYGKTGNPNYLGAEKEVRRNSNSIFLTGCGATDPLEDQNETCNAYNTSYGQAASTTGNITGIYDTSGGAWDAMAGVMKTVENTNLTVADSLFEQTELNELGKLGKYLETYDYSTSSYDRNRGRLGDGTKEFGPYNHEISAWYQDAQLFAYDFQNRVWFIRGSHAVDKELGGMLAYTARSGFAGAGITGRTVIL